jgi:short-subunit dehydrogenase
MLKRGLAITGCTCLTLICMASLKLLFMLCRCCDGVTASARLPGGAYQGKVVWIMGALSSLGRELSMQLGCMGAKLILTARTVDALEHVAECIKARNNKDVFVLPADMSRIESLPSDGAKAVADYGGIGVFVNNAGYLQRELGANTDFEVDVVNYLLDVCLTKALLPSMTASGGGRLINISSVAGKVGIPVRTAYCMQGFFDALRAEEFARGSGIRVTNICPGSVRTNVALNAVGSKVGQSDSNIEAGLDPVWVCERILAVAHSNLNESWMAVRKEMVFLLLAQYLPSTAKSMLCKKAKGMIVTTLADVKKSL